MLISRNVNALVDQLEGMVSSGLTIGFVPTMGALHDGHLSLVEKARSDCDIVVVSVFVNPTQFNEQKDLDNYPRNEHNDEKLLRQVDCDVMFAPAVTEIYPTEHRPEFELNGLDATMEGAHRPGHFNGVVQVVDRLFHIVKPDKAYFGQKDFQQLAIIRYSMKNLGHRTEVVACPTVREVNGLARSSRNQLLSDSARKKAGILYQELLAAKACFRTEDSNRSIEDRACTRIKEAGFELDYFMIVDPVNLAPLAELEKGQAIACVAARIEGVRLIDNLMLFG